MKFPPQTPSLASEELGIEHLDSLYRYAMALTKELTTAENLVCETYLNLVKVSSGFRELGSTKSLLFATLRDRWINKPIKQRAGQGLLETQHESEYSDEISENSSDAYPRREEPEDIVRVREAISQLPAELQEILILREFEDFSYREIAMVMNCPAGTVMSRLSLARSRLRMLLMED